MKLMYGVRNQRVVSLEEGMGSAWRWGGDEERFWGARTFSLLIGASGTSPCPLCKFMHCALLYMYIILQ